MQQASLAAQAVLARKDAPTGVSLVMFMQQLGGALFVSIGQNVFTNELVDGLKHVSGIQPSEVVKIGATELINVVDPTSIKAVISAYGALDKVFTVSLPLACVSIVGAASMGGRISSPSQDRTAGLVGLADLGRMTPIRAKLRKLTQRRET